LTACDASAREEVETLSRQHEELATVGRALHDTIGRVLDDMFVERDAFHAEAAGYSKMLRDHMMKEEGDVFPRATRVLDVADWRALDEEFAKRDDPLFGEIVAHRYVALAERLAELRAEKQAHERFWADDLVYTSSAGTRTDKASILAGFDDADTEDSGEPGPVYSAEDVKLNWLGDTAVVAFKLVATPPNNLPKMFYFNTGTFVKRDGEFVVTTELSSGGDNGRRVLHARADVVLASRLPAAEQPVN